MPKSDIKLNIKGKATNTRVAELHCPLSGDGGGILNKAYRRCQ